MCSEKQLDGLCQVTVAFLDCFEQCSGVGCAKCAWKKCRKRTYCPKMDNYYKLRSLFSVYVPPQDQMICPMTVAFVQIVTERNTILLSI
jgi:hypothetical protein